MFDGCDDELKLQFLVLILLTDKDAQLFQFPPQERKVIFQRYIIIRVFYFYQPGQFMDEGLAQHFIQVPFLQHVTNAQFYPLILTFFNN